MSATKEPASELLIIACAGASHLGRLTFAAARALSSEASARLLSIGTIADFPGVIMNIDSCERYITVDGCQSQCMQQLLTRLGRPPEFHLILSELGLEQQKTATVVKEELELAKDAILAGATRISGIFPKVPCCC